MDAEKAAQLIEQLGENVSGLKESLRPLFGDDLNETANKLPVLDRAKLYIFVTYTIESILFSNLRLQGIDAKEHPIFTELARVRQYFEKIKAAEQGDQKPSLKLDRAAAGRFVKHDLASNNVKAKKRRFNDDGTETTSATLAGYSAATGAQQTDHTDNDSAQKASSKPKRVPRHESKTKSNRQT